MEKLLRMLNKCIKHETCQRCKKGPDEKSILVCESILTAARDTIKEQKKKQKPMQTKVEFEDCGFGELGAKGECPNCGELIRYSNHPKFYGYCGQAIQWMVR